MCGLSKHVAIGIMHTVMKSYSGYLATVINIMFAAQFIHDKNTKQKR